MKNVVFFRVSGNYGRHRLLCSRPAAQGNAAQQVDLRCEIFFYTTRNYKDDGDGLPTFGGAMRIYFPPNRPSLLKDVEGLAAKYVIIKFNYRLLALMT